MVDAKWGRWSPPSTPAQKTRAAFGLGKNPTPVKCTGNGEAFTEASAAFISSTRASLASPTNFKVTCKPSTRAQRASGASRRARSMYFVKPARTSAGISSAMKMRMLHQLATDHVKGLLRGPVAYAVTITGENPLDDFCMAAVSQRVEDETYWLFIRSARRAGYTRDAYPKICFAVVTNSFSQRGCNLATNCAMFCDQQRWYPGKGRLY